MATNERNVVILGKVGSGKKTLGNQIAGEDIFQHGSALGTRNVDAYYGQCVRENTIYRIQTVDTEGLQTGYKNPIPDITEKFQEIHLIILVVANGRYTDESHRSLIRATNSLSPQAKSLCALVVTHCEGLTEDQLRDIVAEFKDDARTSQVTASIGKEIFTVGFPNTSKLPHQLKQIYEADIAEGRETIRQLVDSCKSSLSIGNLTEESIPQPISAEAPDRESRRICSIL